jgi:hypothetical protein
MSRRRAVTLLALGALAFGARGARAQGAMERAVRFDLTVVDDSTFTFDVERRGWIKPGARGITVDPRRRDVLVARFRVLEVANGTAVALVTGQTTRLTDEHVAVLRAPPRKWYRTRDFWVGAAAGALAGVAGALASK